MSSTGPDAGGGAAGPPVGPEASAGGSASRTVSPSGLAGQRRSATAAFGLGWTPKLRVDRHMRTCYRHAAPTSPLPTAGTPVFQAVQRIANATPKGKFEIHAGNVKDRTVVHPDVVRVARTLPGGLIRDTLETEIINKDCAHRRASLGLAVDAEVTKMITAVTETAVSFGCRQLDAHMAASVAFGNSYRRALDVSRDAAVATLRRNLEDTWASPAAAAAAGPAAAEEDFDDDDPAVEGSEEDDDDYA